jgi:hypothetical protein
MSKRYLLPLVALAALGSTTVMAATPTTQTTKTTVHKTKHAVAHKGAKATDKNASTSSKSQTSGS